MIALALLILLVALLTLCVTKPEILKTAFQNLKRR